MADPVITHAFVSAKSDGGDATLVRPTDWNDDHVLTKESYDDVVTDIGGAVHRWKFDESSGEPQDSIGSLHMTTGGGTQTYQQPGPLGSTSVMRATAGFNGSGNGSAPTGANARTFVYVVKTTTGTFTDVSLLSYGPTGSTRQWNHCCFNHDGFAQVGILFWSDDHKPGHFAADGEWHLVAWRYAGRAVAVWVDGSQVYYGQTGATINTGTTGNLAIGGHSADYDDVIIFNKWVTNGDLLRLWNSIAANV